MITDIKACCIFEAEKFLYKEGDRPIFAQGTGFFYFMYLLRYAAHYLRELVVMSISSLFVDFSSGKGCAALIAAYYYSTYSYGKKNKGTNTTTDPGRSGTDLQHPGCKENLLLFQSQQGINSVCDRRSKPGHIRTYAGAGFEKITTGYLPKQNLFAKVGQAVVYSYNFFTLENFRVAVIFHQVAAFFISIGRWPKTENLLSFIGHFVLSSVCRRMQHCFFILSGKFYINE